MKNRKVIRLTEGDLKRMIFETIEKLQEDGSDKFVNWDDVVAYWNYGADFVEKNREKSDKLGIPYDCRCAFCQKGLKDGYKTLYWREPSEDEYADGGSSSRFYADSLPGTEPIKIGNTCYKSFAKAFKEKYGKRI